MTHYTPDELALLGDRIDDLREFPPQGFWREWSAAIVDMPYVVFRTARDGIRIGTLADYPDFGDYWSDMLRCHLFGPGGDLIWRRDGKRYFWRYVGKPHADLPQGQNYWDKPPKVEKLVTDDTDQARLKALLWGRYDSLNDQWFEPRVGKATVTDRLRYPVADPEPGSHIVIEAQVLRHPEDHSVVAIWTDTLYSISAEQAGED